MGSKKEMQKQWQGDGEREMGTFAGSNIRNKNEKAQ